MTGCIAKKKHGLQKNYRIESSVLILYSGKSGLFARGLRCLDLYGKKLRLGCPHRATRISGCAFATKTMPWAKEFRLQLLPRDCRHRRAVSVLT